MENTGVYKVFGCMDVIAQYFSKKYALRHSEAYDF